MIKNKYVIQETKVSLRKIILKGRNINKDGQAPIYIEIISFFPDGSRKTRRIPTNQHVKPKDWESKKDGYVKTSDPDSDNKNNIINSLFTKYGFSLIEREKGTHTKNFDPKDLISIEDLFPQERKTLTTYIDQYVKYREDTKTPYNTVKGFKTLKGRIERYETDQNIKLTFEDITLTFSDSFYTFLLKEKFSSGTISKTYTLLITCLGYFYDRRKDFNINDLTDTFKNKRFRRGQSSENDPHAVSKIEFTKLLNHTFKTPEMTKTQQRFLLQCSLGCRYSDLFLLTKDMFVNDVLTYYPTKTRNKRNNKVVVPLNKVSKTILEGLNYDTRPLYITNQRYNENIGNMFKELQKVDPETFKDTTYTSHDCRDSFITFCLQSGVDIPTLLRMCGQESYEILKKYFKSTTEHAIERMSKVEVFQ